jgi:DNA-binding NtrC family response regulator
MTYSEHGDGAGAAILVVDDDEEVRRIIAEYLTEMGHCVLQAANGVEALRVLKEVPTVALVITDIRMPDMTGVELSEALARQREEVRVILISGYFLAQTAGRRTLRKPFHMRELQAAVEEELALGAARHSQRSLGSRPNRRWPTVSK